MSALTERRRVMPVAERDRLKREVAQEERDMEGNFDEVSRAGKKMLMTRPDAGKKLVNKKALEKKLRAIREGDPGPLSAIEKGRLEKRETELVSECRKLMVPVEDVRLMPSEKGSTNPDFSRAVNDMARNEHSPAFIKKAHELKNIRRRLNPDDPQAGNLEAIRPRRGESGAR